MFCANCDPNVAGDPLCGPSGTCEPNAYCSLPDASCPSGHRYSNAGSLSGICVRDQLPDGGLFDSPPNAGSVCYGAAPFTICFATAPTGTIDVGTSTTFDTGTGTSIGTQLSCATTMSGGALYCVVAANTITINSVLRAVGSKPLVLVAADSINVPATIDVSSHRNSSPPPADSIGAGADPTTGCLAGNPPNTGGGISGGGAGGSFIGAGGNGGNGGGGAGGAHGSAPGLGTVLRGGCPGQTAQAAAMASTATVAVPCS
jgi:hypothetical protein